jgi:hypothetical protein
MIWMPDYTNPPYAEKPAFHLEMGSIKRAFIGDEGSGDDTEGVRFPAI